MRVPHQRFVTSKSLNYATMSKPGLPIIIQIGLGALGCPHFALDSAVFFGKVTVAGAARSCTTCSISWSSTCSTVTLCLLGRLFSAIGSTGIPLSGVSPSDGECVGIRCSAILLVPAGAVFVSSVVLPFCLGGGSNEPSSVSALRQRLVTNASTTALTERTTSRPIDMSSAAELTISTYITSFNSVMLPADAGSTCSFELLA